MSDFKQILDNIKRYVELTEEDEKEFIDQL